MRRLLVIAWMFAVTLSTGISAADDAVQPPPAKEILTVGEPLPDFESPDDVGNPWKLSDHVGRKVLVFYFYPGDFTGGCIRQAVAFRDGLKKLEALDIEVVGVSGDSMATHQLFKDSYDLKHSLLTDAEGTLAEQLGVPVQKRAQRVPARNSEGKPLLDSEGAPVFIERKVTFPRWTLIIDRKGKLISKRTRINPATDAEEVQKIVAELPQ
jgi:thioredoxin-dependent peroxiredoxin